MRSPGPSRAPSPALPPAASPTSIAPSTDVEMVDAVSVDDGEEEDLLASPAPKRKRGRPATTGDYVDIARARNEAAEAKLREMEADEVAKIIDPSTGLTTSARRKMEEEVAQYHEEGLESPAQDLVAQMLIDVERVLRVSGISKGLNGQCQKSLKKAAYRTRAYAAILGDRAQMCPENSFAAEMGNLRRELESSRSEVAKLREEIERLKGEAASSSTPARKGRTGRARGAEKAMSPASSGEGVPPPSPVVLPPREEWPPVVRPPIQGVARILEDPLPPPTPRSSHGTASPLSDEAVMSRLDRLFERWARERWGGQPPASNPPLPHAPLPNKKGAPPPPPPSQKRVTGKGGKKREERGSGAKARPSATSAKPAVPPPPPPPPKPTQPPQGETWVEVVDRRGRAKAKTAPNAAPKSGVQRGEKGSSRPTAGPPKKGGPSQSGRTSQPGKGAQKASPAQQKRAAKRRAHRAAAVTITCPPGTYADTLRQAREKIPLEELGIQGLRARRAQTGALIMEVPGSSSGEKADALADRLRQVLADREGVRVSRPVKTADIRLRGLDDSAAAEDVVAAMCAAGGCGGGEIKVGDIRASPRGLGTCWARCPLAAANKIAAAGKLKVGWVVARVELLAARPLQCFRCMELGHVRAACHSDVDRSNICYRCGVAGHPARGCTAPPRCALCAEAGKPAGHRVGSKICAAPRSKKKGGKGKGQRPAPTPANAATTPAPPPTATGEEAMEVEVVPPKESGGKKPQPVRPLAEAVVVLRREEADAAAI